MSATPVAYVPASLRAGDTWKWTQVAPSDYPSPTWTLKYEFQGPSRFTVTAADSSGSYAVSIAATLTKTYPPGTYRWMSYFTAGGEEYQYESGSIEILPDLRTVQGGFDARSFAKQALATIETTILNNLSKPMESQAEAAVSIGYRSWADMLSARSKLKLEVEAEEAAANIARGLGSGQRVLVRHGVVR